MSVALQTIRGVHISSGGGFVAGRTAKATPVAGQHIDHSTVDSTQLISPISAVDGSWELRLIRGIVYDVKIDRWAVRTIRVTDDEEIDFSWYLQQSLEITDGSTAIPPGSITQYLRGDRTWRTLDKAAVGLAYVDDTSDLDKPISSAVAEALEAKLSRPTDTTEGKQLTFDAYGEVVASQYDVGTASGSVGTPAERAAGGERRWVRGYAVSGLPDAYTQAAIDALLAAGWPEWAIVWESLGEAAGTVYPLVVDSAAITPQISAVTLTGVLPVDNASITPVADAVGLVGVLAVDSATITPQISTAELVPEGVLAVEDASITPVIDAVTLVGTLAVDSATITPTITIAELGGVGVLSVDSATITPTISTVSLVGVLTVNSASITPQISTAELTAAASGTTLDDFSTTIPTTIAGTTMAGTATVQGWTIANSGTDPAVYGAYDSFTGAYISTYTPSFSGNGLRVTGCHTEIADPNEIVGTSGFKLSKTWTGPFSPGTFTLKYKNFSSPQSIKVNGVAIGSLSYSTAWQTATIAVDSAMLAAYSGNITLEIESAPTTNTTTGVDVDSLFYQ